MPKKKKDEDEGKKKKNKKKKSSSKSKKKSAKKSKKTKKSSKKKAKKETKKKKEDKEGTEGSEEDGARLTATLSRERVLLEDSDDARNLVHQKGYGKILDNKNVQLSLLEGLFLMERGKLEIQDPKGKEMDYDTFLKKAQKVEPKFWVRYSVFKDVRKRGYIIKTALKFGADFRVYDRGIKPGEDHARWIVYPVHEGETLTWHEFAAKNRVAHSTKKRLLIGVVDDEGDVSYWEVRWMRP